MTLADLTHPSTTSYQGGLVEGREQLWHVPEAYIPPEVLRFEIQLRDPIDLGDGTFLRRKRPLLVKVEKTEDGLHSSAPDIRFDDLVENYAELISTTNAMCALLWREYAQADDKHLAEDARQLKQRILHDFEVI